MALSPFKPHLLREPQGNGIPMWVSEGTEHIQPTAGNQIFFMHWWELRDCGLYFALGSNLICLAWPKPGASQHVALVSWGWSAKNKLRWGGVLTNKPLLYDFWRLGVQGQGFRGAAFFWEQRGRICSSFHGWQSWCSLYYRWSVLIPNFTYMMVSLSVYLCTYFSPPFQGL